MSASALSELQRWYASRCDGDWEHQYGISVQSLDNPGWLFKVQLTGTKWENIEFSELKINADDPQRWIVCRKANATFEGACAPEKLEKVIDIFLRWTEES